MGVVRESDKGSVLIGRQEVKEIVLERLDALSKSNKAAEDDYGDAQYSFHKGYELALSHVKTLLSGIDD